MEAQDERAQMDEIIAEASRRNIPVYGFIAYVSDAPINEKKLRDYIRAEYGEQAEANHYADYMTARGYRTCNKCNGTGEYVMEIRNGQKWSATGTKCYPCGGTGWKKNK